MPLNIKGQFSWGDKRHKPDCSCVNCVNRRLEVFRESRKSRSDSKERPRGSEGKAATVALAAILCIVLIAYALFMLSCANPNLIGSTDDAATPVTDGQNTDSSISFKTGDYNNFFLGLVHTNAGVLSGDGCYDDKGSFVVLINNRDAVDPTYTQLLDFLRAETVDQYPYIYTNQEVGTYYGSAESHVDLKNVQNIIDGTAQPADPDVCSDFAERLHNDAEAAGIRSAFVALDMEGYSDPSHLGIPSNAGHACDAFQTTDRGLIYVDATGMPAGEDHPQRLMAAVKINVGQEYIPVSLFPEAGWQSAGSSMGTVTNMQVVWDGEWNAK
jgi:hypothetical protein